MLVSAGTPGLGPCVGSLVDERVERAATTMTMTSTTAALIPTAFAAVLREWERTRIRLPLGSVRM